MKNYQSIFITITAFLIAVNTINGNVHQYINFSDSLNEMLFTFMSFVIGITGLLSINYNKIYKALI